VLYIYEFCSVLVLFFEADLAPYPNTACDTVDWSNDAENFAWP